MIGPAVNPLRAVVAQFALSSRAAFFWRARDLGAACEMAVRFLRGNKAARLSRIPN